MKQNGVVCYPGPALFFFVFRFECFDFGPEKLAGLSRNGPLASKTHSRFQTWRWLQNATYMFSKTEIMLFLLRLERLQHFPKVRRWAPDKSH